MSRPTALSRRRHSRFPPAPPTRPRSSRAELRRLPVFEARQRRAFISEREPDPKLLEADSPTRSADQAMTSWVTLTRMNPPAGFRFE